MINAAGQVGGVIGVAILGDLVAVRDGFVAGLDLAMGLAGAAPFWPARC